MSTPAVTSGYDPVQQFQQQAQQNVSNDAAISVLKKALDNESQSAMVLINSISQSTANLPPNLGQNINVTA
jgi:hypothetical protein